MLKRKLMWRKPPMVQIAEWNGVDLDELSALPQVQEGQDYTLSLRNSDGAAVFTANNPTVVDFEVLPGQHIILDGSLVVLEDGIPDEYLPYPDEWLR